MGESITILIPAFNEAERIENTINSLKSLDMISRIVVIDDGSKDKTFELSKHLGVEAYDLKKNRGKGYALNFGIKKVLSSSTIIVFLDADLGSSAMEVKKLILPIVNKEADVTIARFPSPKKRGGFGLVKGLSRLGVHRLTGKMISSALSGQRAFRTDVLKELGDLPEDYGVEVGMIIDILNKGFKVKEVAVNMTHRETGRDIAGFIHRGKQFYQILRVILRKYKEVKYSCF